MGGCGAAGEDAAERYQSCPLVLHMLQDLMDQLEARSKKEETMVAKEKIARIPVYICGEWQEIRGTMCISRQSGGRSRTYTLDACRET